jgi:hypothetical protein
VRWRRAVKKDEEAEEDAAGGAVHCSCVVPGCAARWRFVSGTGKGCFGKAHAVEHRNWDSRSGNGGTRRTATAAQKERVLTEARLDATFGNRRELPWPSVPGSADAIRHASRRGQRDATISQGFT